MSNECNVSSDCSDPIAGVIKVCYEEAAFSDEVFFCECSAWYGWKGENCDVATGQNVFYFIMLMFLSIWCLFIQIAIARTMYLHFKHGKRTKRWDPVVVTAALLFTSSLLYMIHSILISTAIIDSTRFEIVNYPVLGSDTTVEDLTTTAGKEIGYTVLAGACLGSFATLQVFSSWQKTAIEAARFGAERTQIVAARTLIGIRVFMCVFVVILLSFTILDQLAVITLLMGFFSLMLGIGYPVAYCILSETFKGLKVDGNEYVQRMVATIKFCCKTNAISLFIAGVFLTIFYPLLVFEEFILTPGKFNYIVLFRDLALSAALFQATTMAWYVNTVANRGITDRTSTGIWKSWDTEHQKMFIMINTKNITNGASKDDI